MNSTRLDALKKFLEDEPADPFNHYAVALEYAAQKEYATAIRGLERLIDLDPDYIPAYHQLASMYSLQDRRVDAIGMYARGIGAATRVGDRHAAEEMSEALAELESE